MCSSRTTNSSLRIREAAEREEKAFYGGRGSDRWIRDLEPVGTNWQRPFIEIAPALIVVFAQTYGSQRDERHYYVNESVGIAVGFLLAALHYAGLATLTHTPSPMNFLRTILERPDNGRAYVLIPVRYPALDAEVPDITKKSSSEVLVVEVRCDRDNRPGLSKHSPSSASPVTGRRCRRSGPPCGSADASMRRRVGRAPRSRT